MKQNPYIIIMSILIFTFLSACSVETRKEDEFMPGFDIPIAEFNTAFYIEPNPGMATINKNGDVLVFLIRNLSEHKIIFNSDFNIQIFSLDDSVWEPIENNMSYAEGDNILYPTDVDPTGLGLFVTPNVGELAAQTTIRILIFGEVEGSKEKAGAYTDVQYIP